MEQGSPSEAFGMSESFGTQQTKRERTEEEGEEMGRRGEEKSRADFLNKRELKGEREETSAGQTHSRFHR